MNWFLGFLMGILLTAGYHRIDEHNQQQMVRPVNDPEDLISAYNRGVRDVLRLNPIDARLESACIQLWGLKQ